MTSSADLILYAIGYVAFDNAITNVPKPVIQMIDQVARPVSGTGLRWLKMHHFTGLQGKYYMTGVSTDGKDTIDL